MQTRTRLGGSLKAIGRQNQLKYRIRKTTSMLATTKLANPNRCQPDHTYPSLPPKPPRRALAMLIHHIPTRRLLSALRRLQRRVNTLLRLHPPPNSGSNWHALQAPAALDPPSNSTGSGQELELVSQYSISTSHHFCSSPGQSRGGGGAAASFRHGGCSPALSTIHASFDSSSGPILEQHPAVKISESEAASASPPPTSGKRYVFLLCLSLFSCADVSP